MKEMAAQETLQRGVHAPLGVQRGSREPGRSRARTKFPSNGICIQAGMGAQTCRPAGARGAEGAAPGHQPAVDPRGASSTKAPWRKLGLSGTLNDG